MQYSLGTYGFLQHEKMTQQPLVLLDMGIEHRHHESYFFDNANRAPYAGYLLQYTLAGSGIYQDTHTHRLTEGMGFFSHIPENSCYYLPSPDTCKTLSSEVFSNTVTNTALPTTLDESWTFFYLHFDGPAAKPFYDTMRSLCGPTFSLSLNSPAIMLFLHLFEQCHHHKSLKLYEGGEFLYRFLSQLLREIESPSQSVSPLVAFAKEYIATHFQALQGIHEVSDLAQVSHEHLSRCFRKEIGHTPQQYLTKLRVEHALYLLLNTSLSIQEIATTCGFQNGNYFAKVFKKFLQCSPEEYRKMNRVH